MGTFVNDLVFTFRNLRKNPAFTAAAGTLLCSTAALSEKTTQ